MGIVLIILDCIARWKLYEKAGEEGWKTLIPYYRNYIYCKIAGSLNLFVGMLIMEIIMQVSAVYISIKSIKSTMTDDINLKDMELVSDEKIFIAAIIILVIAAVVYTIMWIMINYQFVNSYTYDKSIAILACIGSIRVLNLVLIIARCILAFDERYIYMPPKFNRRDEGSFTYEYRDDVYGRENQDNGKTGYNFDPQTGEPIEHRNINRENPGK